MFDAYERPVEDPSTASRTITSYYDGRGRLMKRVLGKPIIIRSDDSSIPSADH